MKLTADQIKNTPTCSTTQISHFKPLHHHSDKMLDVFGLISMWMNATDEENFTVSFTNENINIIWMSYTCIYSFSINYANGCCILKADCAPIDIRDLIVDICRTLECNSKFFV